MPLDLRFEEPTDASILIADVKGAILLIENLKGVQTLNKVINVNNLAAGTYLIRVGTKEGTKTKRFVKQ